MNDIRLSTNNLHVSYGAIKALKGVNITVKAGSVTAILGANGGGKSTLLKTISGIIKPASGTISFNGIDITPIEPERITSMGIVHVPEGRQIFGELSVYENLMIGAFTVTSATIHTSIVRLEEYQDVEEDEIYLTRKEMIANNLLRVYEYFPVLQERQHQQAGSLSGGEQQMLAIGRALMGNPSLLILDEPSLGLAPLIVRDIFRIIKELNETIGLTVLIVEQNAMQTLKIADYAYLLQVGKLVKEGQADTLLHDTSLVEAYLGS